ncbi:hypothetical protein [Streptomyces albipurpureus]|nr:hypothetical protein [Streptomyces sp. CWNU-1]
MPTRPPLSPNIITRCVPGAVLAITTAHPAAVPPPLLSVLRWE